MKQLRDRLDDAKGILAEVRQKIATDPTIEQTVHDCYGDLKTTAARVDEWQDLINARSSALDELKVMPKPASRTGSFATGPASPPFRHQRLLACQAYLAVSWSLSDEIAQWAGSILASPKLARDPHQPCNLPQFSKSNGHIINPLSVVFNSQFEWPISLSYSLRNLFLHESGRGIFEGSDLTDGFRIGNDGWEHIRDNAEKADPAKSAARFPVFVPPVADLREVFEACETEMDDVLGVLLATACGLLRVHACCMLGEQ